MAMFNTFWRCVYDKSSTMVSLILNGCYVVRIYNCISIELNRILFSRLHFYEQFLAMLLSQSPTAFLPNEMKQLNITVDRFYF